MTFVLLTGGEIGGMMKNFAISFPACIVLCAIYYGIISRLSHISFFVSHNAIRILADWLSTTAIGLGLMTLIRIIIGASNDWLSATMTFTLWNSMAMLGMELYIYHHTIIEKEAQLAHAEKEKAAYQFEALKQQLNPHFLFNSLNALASLAYQDAEKTNLFAKKLSAVYRYLLQTADKPLVSIHEELQFLHAYLYLEEIRFGQAIQVDINIPDSIQAEQIVPASLQLLVENAIKHNIATDAEPLRISITVKENTIRVENNLQPRGEVISNKKGLSNLATQYKACGKEIKIEKTPKSFAVWLPIFNK